MNNKDLLEILNECDYNNDGVVRPFLVKKRSIMGN